MLLLLVVKFDNVTVTIGCSFVFGGLPNQNPAYSLIAFVVSEWLTIIETRAPKQMYKWCERTTSLCCTSFDLLMLVRTKKTHTRVASVCKAMQLDDSNANWSLIALQFADEELLLDYGKSYWRQMNKRKRKESNASSNGNSNTSTKGETLPDPIVVDTR